MHTMGTWKWFRIALWKERFCSSSLIFYSDLGIFQHGEKDGKWQHPVPDNTLISFKIPSLKSWLLGNEVQTPPAESAGPRVDMGLLWTKQAHGRGYDRGSPWMCHGLVLSRREQLNADMPLKTGCTTAANYFGNGLLRLNCSTSLQTSTKTLSAGGELWDQYQACDLYTNAAI